MALRHILKKVGSPLNYLKKVCGPPRASVSSSSGSRSYGTVVNRKRHTASTTALRPNTRNIKLGSWMRTDSVFLVQDAKDFQKRVLNSKVPTIVDFYATWCGPCKLLVPKLEQLVAKKKGQVMLAKVDIDTLADLADTYEVNAVPTVIAMKNGKEVDKFVGLKDDAELETFVDKLINK